MNENVTESEVFPVGQLIWSIVLIWAAISVVPYLIQGFYSPLDGWKLADHALLGDTFGFTNSFFSSLALAFLVYSSYIQRKDLGHQRKVFQEQLLENRRSAQAQEASERALRAQAASLKATARINALGVLIHHHTDEIQRERLIGGAGADFILRREQLVEELEQILDEKNPANATYWST